MIDDVDFFTEENDGIAISACPTLIEKSRNSRLWGYYLCIENRSKSKISLVGKNWNITDDKGNRFSDDSWGFKGEIPELDPGEYFEFTSTAPLDSQNAVFYGSCKVRIGADKNVKNVKIPTFPLCEEKVFGLRH